jgi:retinol dehydrogenase 12
MQLLIVREFADELNKSTKPGKVVTSVVNPGFVATQIMRQQGPLFQIYQKVLQKTLARSPEEGSRTLVHAAEGGEETHGQYLDDCRVGTYVLRIRQSHNNANSVSSSAFVLSAEGEVTQKKLWQELAEKLERMHPGITQNI